MNIPVQLSLHRDIITAYTDFTTHSTSLHSRYV